MSLKINSNQLEEMKSDIGTILNDTSSSYDSIVNLLDTISSDWDTEGSETFVSKFKSLTNTFDSYTNTLENVINYLTETEEDYEDVQNKVTEIIN